MPRLTLMCIGALLAWLAACVSNPVQAAEPPSFELRAVRDLAYHDGGDADPVKHKLDLYLPRDHRDFPVVFFVHGGAWISGDKNYFGIYSALGTMFARRGIGAVITNYRLSPEVTHPEHVKDVARAFAWTCRNIARYGGRPDQVFACGHSAGGHLVALLATDDQYLRAEGLDLKAIRGVVPISGVYRIPERMFQRVFGMDAELCRKASPLNHARADAPPFLILYAERDFPTCDQISEEFCRALQDRKARAESQAIKGRNHMTIILNAVSADDPTARSILDFIDRHTQDTARKVEATEKQP